MSKPQHTDWEPSRRSYLSAVAVADEPSPAAKAFLDQVFEEGRATADQRVSSLTISSSNKATAVA